MGSDRRDHDPVPPRKLEHGDQPTGPILSELEEWPLLGLYERATGSEEQPTGTGPRDQGRVTRRGSGREGQPTGTGLGDQAPVPAQGPEREEQPTGPGLGGRGPVSPQRRGREEQPTSLDLRDQGLVPPPRLAPSPRRGREEQPTSLDLRDQGLVPLPGLAPPPRSVPEGEFIGRTADWFSSRTRGPQYQRPSATGELRDERIEEFDKAIHKLSSDKRFVLLSYSPGSVRLMLYRH
jgi:hypothetical protein